MFFKIKLLVLVFLSTSLFSEMITRSQLVMATLITIKIESKYENLIDNGFIIIKNVDTSLSSYKLKSVISRLNKDKKVKPDALSYEALKLSSEYYKKSDGYFNIAIGSITKDLYRFGEDERVPLSASLQKAKINFNSLNINEKEVSIGKGVKLDLGGIGKGFGVDKISEYFKKEGVQKAIISASGDIRCLDKCLISVQNPFNEDVLLNFKTTKKDLGITTSGNYNRYIDDKTNNHLINPKNKRPAQNFASVTLVGDMKSSALDAYATAVSGMPKDKAYTFLDSLGVAYVVVDVNSKIVIKPLKFFELVLNLK